MMSGVTEHLGLGVTRSVTYYSPYDIARTFATLDHLSNGRAAWNVVTSINDGEARNFGAAQHLQHEARYDRAEEFLEVVHKLWGSWTRTNCCWTSARESLPTLQRFGISIITGPGSNAKDRCRYQGRRKDVRRS
jgi:alkanesulfonate monooxygenase SsuD/methylene tetrahydromethanopterin reductase-like flavin-dependent oxidoreductase (luciferase family)